MVKLISIILLGCSLIGCSTYSNRDHEVDRFSTKSSVRTSMALDEELLIKSGNYEGLIAFYKRKLADRDHLETRIKLSNIYLEKNDPESALFTLSTVLPNQSTYRVHYIRASSYHELTMWREANNSINNALHLQPENGEALNLAGVIAAEKNDISRARVFFNQARMNMYDDIKIKINLSMLDLIEEDYEKVVDRLMPFYTNKGMNTSDDIIIMLSLALAKTDRKEQFESLLSLDYQKKSIDEMYHYLSNVTLY